MKTLLLSSLLFVLPGGDREEGLALYQQGRYADAAAAFRRAIESEGDSADLQFNLALASWRAGDLATAETAVEKYAALADAARADLHAGMLGAVRYDEAKALEAQSDAAQAALATPPADPEAQPEDPLPPLEQALEKARQARDHFVRGATEVASPELLRNTERALTYIAELEDKIEELKKQREEQQSDEQGEDEQKSDDEPEEDQEKKPDPQQDEKEQGEEGEQEQGDPKPDEQQTEQEQGAEQPPEPEQQSSEKNRPDQGQENQQGEQEQPPPPEPEPGESETPEAQAEEPPEPQPQRNDAPGEGAEGRELTPEQAQRLLDKLQKLDQQLEQLRKLGKQRRKPVERDW